MSNLPSYISDELKADRKNRWISGRVTEGEYQFFLDLMSEWEVEKKSSALRALIRFAAVWLPKIAEMKEEPLTERLETSAELMMAMAAATRRKNLEAELCRVYMMAMETVHEPTKRRLLAAAQKHAEIHDLKWPPVGSDPLQTDPSMRYVYERVVTLLDQRNNGKLTLRDLVANSTGNKEDIAPILASLEKGGYLTMEEERRSGPPTIWIRVPTLGTNC